MPVVCNRMPDDGMGRMSTKSGPVASGDVAQRALEELVVELDRCLAELAAARTRAEKLLVERRAGRPWLDIVTGEARPLVVERISTVLAGLSAAGHSWRREQAAALQAEHVSINRIAALFGVTRQRISALLREDAPEAGRA
jgi:hypothetical protein